MTTNRAQTIATDGTDFRSSAPASAAPAPGPARNVLILCDAETRRVGTIGDHLAAFGKYSAHRVCIVDTPSAAKFDIDLGKFDVVVLHYSLIISSARQVSPAIAAKIRAFAGYKIVFIQDEYRWVDRSVAAIADLGIDLIYTVINPEAVDRIYHHPSIAHVRRKVTLTGFVPEELTRLAVPDFADRPIDVGYRARQVPAWLGRFAQEKWWIGQRFRDEAEPRGLRCDIDHSESRRLYGDRWIAFVSGCKAMLGTESGASYIDFTGEVQAAVEALERDDPRIPFEEIHRRLLADRDGDIVIRVISPRCFEAAALRTLMILYPGDYSGVLQPWRHYVPLERDHGNIDEVVAVLRDPVRARQIIDNAYLEVALNPRYSFRAMVEAFDADVAEHAPLPPEAARTQDAASCGLPRDRSEGALRELERRIDGHFRHSRRFVIAVRQAAYDTVHWLVSKLVPERRRPAMIAAIRSAARRIGFSSKQ